MEKGVIKDVDSKGVSIPLEINAIMGKRASKFEIGLGVTAYLVHRDETYEKSGFISAGGYDMVAGWSISKYKSVFSSEHSWFNKYRIPSATKKRFLYETWFVASCRRFEMLSHRWRNGTPQYMPWIYNPPFLAIYLRLYINVFVPGHYI